jgi:hypothetical protein
VNDYGGNTPSLLRFVYLTEPMLRAAPRERLVFVGTPRRPPQDAAPSPAEEKLSVKERRARRAALDARKAEFQKRLREQQRANEQLRPAYPPPRYDDVFFEGTEALDRDVGAPIRATEGDAVLDARVWKSSSRSSTDG